MTLWLTAWVVGLLSGVHCLGMCGGIATTLTLGLPREQRLSWRAMLPYQLSYSLGRILSYGLAGALVGLLGLAAREWLPLHYGQQALWLLAGSVMILMGLYLGGWWNLAARIENLGAPLWRRLEPVSRRLLPIRQPRQALLIGLLWGWLPCGLVYSTLIWSLSLGSPMQGALLMMVFGLGTLPNLLSMGLAIGGLARWTRRAWFKHLAGMLVIGAGLHHLWLGW